MGTLLHRSQDQDEDEDEGQGQDQGQGSNEVHVCLRHAWRYEKGAEAAGVLIILAELGGVRGVRHRSLPSWGPVPDGGAVPIRDVTTPCR